MLDNARHRLTGGGISHGGEDAEGEEEEGVVPEMRGLTLEGWLDAGWSEEDRGGGNRARSAATGVGEDAGVGVDAGDPASIPCPRTKRTTRRRGLRAQLAPGELRSTAMRRRGSGARAASSS